MHIDTSIMIILFVTDRFEPTNIDKVLNYQMHMDTNIIADAVDARQVALNKEANRPNERDTYGRIRPPNK